MLWKKRKEEARAMDEHNRSEIIHNKEVAKEVVEEAKAVNRELNQLLLQNGFTIKLFVAAGGKTKKRHK